MVNPIAPGMSYFPQSPMAADFERPPAIPEAAVTVTPSTETRSSGSATTGTGSGSSENANIGFGTSTNDNSTDGTSPLDQTLAVVNESMKAWSTGMRFDMDDEAQRMVVSITDSKTGDVLRTVPSDAVIRVARMIVKLQGANINTKV